MRGFLVPRRVSDSQRRMAIEFTENTDPDGLKLFDSNEQRQLSIRTAESVAPTPVSADLFCFPVDTSSRIETASLVFDQKYLVNVHDETGRATVRLDAGESYDLDSSVQFIGMDGPMKLYCRVSDPGTVDIGMNSMRLEFDEPVPIEIGVRSLHERPAGTITTPGDPRSMMRAVSAMTSALKTDSPERAWPTLRGHPPLIELGEEFDVRTSNTPLETDVSIEVPPSREAVYAAAPLAFYLGASVIPGSSPTLHTAGNAYAFGEERSFEDDVARTLKRAFVLDCIVRTEGFYRYDLFERTALQDTIPWDLETVYDEPLSTRLDRYFDVPYDRLEPHVPRWPLTAHVPSDPASVEILPFVVNQLGIVRNPRGERKTIETSIDEPAPAQATRAPVLTRSADRTRHPITPPSRDSERVTVVNPDVTDESIEHAWFGEDIPRGASKATVDGYRSQLDRVGRSQTIDILVVCNDARMLDEHDVLDEAYGKREVLPLDVSSEFGVSTDELASLLTDGGYDFLHYIGHATSEGLRCPDGDLDVRTLESVDLGVFFLNACHSYDQGLALAERGAFGGVATVGDVINEYAVESGGALARLLNLGYPLRGALEVVSERTVLGDQYLIVGDGSTDIAQSDGGPPTLVTLEHVSGDELEISFRHYPTKGFQIGSLASPNVDSIEQMHLLPMQDFRQRIAESELEEYFSWTETPVVIEDSLHWNTEIGPPSFLTEL